MSKLEQQQIEALSKINKLREIESDVKLNGIHNPYGVQLLELGELELKEKLDRELRVGALATISYRISELKKEAHQLLGSRDLQTDEPSNHLIEEKL